MVGFGLIFFAGIGFFIDNVVNSILSRYKYKKHRIDTVKLLDELIKKTDNWSREDFDIEINRMRSRSGK
jgi:hypothetical protein